MSAPDLPGEEALIAFHGFQSLPKLPILIFQVYLGRENMSLSTMMNEMVEHKLLDGLLPGFYCIALLAVEM